MTRFFQSSASLGRPLATSLLCLSVFTATGVAVLALAQPAIAQEVPLRTLTVTGRGSQSIDATLAQVQLGVEVQGRTAQEVQAEVARRSNAVVELLRSRNVEKLQTVGLYLSPQYNYDNGRAELVGYIGTNTVSFQTRANQAGTLLDEAVQAGVTQIQGIQFTASDGAIADAQQIALERATADAQRQANTVLRFLNLGPQEIIGIQINGAQGPIPVPLPVQARVAYAEADVATRVEAGEQTIESTVTLQIRY
ncbi:MAG: SIMPL domain-containing protein [Leptolyngbyaceae cyanobacterium T60_A2020_046]|nr:SIMPL domain-containing protein [Leptolyngbyaceae cyanobacterium T60_A2020_046]